MHRSLALIVLFLTAFVSVAAQSPAPSLENKTPNNRAVAAGAIAALSRLDEDVFVYRTLGDFEENRKLARVSPQTFNEHLQEAASEVEAALLQLDDAKLKIEIRNALASYRDGAYWWEKVDDTRVISVSELQASESGTTPTDRFFHANLPYTVAIHWRQANKHLQRAKRQIG